MAANTLMTAAFALAVASISTAAATEPLQDRIWYHSRAGTVHQVGKGVLSLPASDRLRAIGIAETCSAIGGPRGVYRYMSGKLWLVGLHRCSGGIGLRAVYPDMLTPPIATWVNGVVVARLGRFICSSAGGVPVPEMEVTFTIQSGSVVAIVEKAGDARKCAPTIK